MPQRVRLCCNSSVVTRFVISVLPIALARAPKRTPTFFTIIAKRDSSPSYLEKNYKTSFKRSFSKKSMLRMYNTYIYVHLINSPIVPESIPFSCVSLVLSVNVDLGHFLRVVVGGEGWQIGDGRVQHPHPLPPPLFELKPLLKCCLII